MMLQPNLLSLTLIGEREIQTFREFNVPRQPIYDRHMKPDLVHQWLPGPPGWTMPVCEIDACVGGKCEGVLSTGFTDGIEMGYKQLDALVGKLS